MRTVWMVLGLAFVFSGCGGGGGSSDTGSSTPGETIEMVTDRVYTVYPGDRIEKTTDDAQVWISHQQDHAESEVKLLVGGANLIRNGG
ncbi:MAG: hypothetical protein GXO33_08245 [Epsilonproteobacteria bacterium]|nr:hypothetical protein [Campylobacterota bacterium]